MYENLFVSSSLTPEGAFVRSEPNGCTSLSKHWDQSLLIYQAAKRDKKIQGNPTAANSQNTERRKKERKKTKRKVNKKIETVCEISSLPYSTGPMRTRRKRRHK